MLETSKSMVRRMYDQRFATRYFVGHGIDIGCGPDPLSSYHHFFPLMQSLKAWDIPDGDAMFMADVPNDCYNFVHSSHCLEHLVNPALAIRNWVRICKPGGHIVIIVPDEDLYEQGVWPSTYNEDHKWTFTTGKAQSWSPKSINVFELLVPELAEVAIIRVDLLDIGFIYHAQRIDQTASMTGECAIEIVLQRLTEADIAARGRLPRSE